MARFAIVTTRELGSGFRLAGAEVHVAEGVDEARRMLHALLDEADIGVVGVHAPFLDEFEPSLRSRLDDMVAPVVVGVPAGIAAAGPSEHRARLAGVLQRAIGHRISFLEEGEES